MALSVPKLTTNELLIIFFLLMNTKKRKYLSVSHKKLLYLQSQSNN